MNLRESDRFEFVALALLVFAGAGVCRVGWSHITSALPQSAGDSELTALQGNFRHPPEDAEIMVRWWWFGPAVITAELDRELRQMKDAGIGGFEVQPVYPLTVDDPSKGLINLRYLSPEFLAAVSSTARTAHELGLRMDMTMGSGWPFGGPHITPDLAAERLLCLRVSIKEGAQAIPGPPLQQGQRFLAAFVASGEAKHFDATSAHQIAPQQDGSFLLPASSAGPRVLLFFVAGLTGQQVKRAAVGAEGNVLDHYSREAMQKHMEAVGAPLAAAGGGNIRAMFCDSLEVYDSDWTEGFRKEFQTRRGYDLTPHLPALIAGSGPEAASVRHDWGQTLTELLNENFLEPFQTWCHQHHVLARVQAYGQPPAQLSSYRFVDLPEGEQGDEAGHWNHFTASRWASSAGHLYGAPVISAEAWTWIHTLPFRATPLDIKATADEYFLQGINQFVAHGYPYSPPGVPEPGWHFYAAGAFGPHNPWWFAMPDLARYLQRGSFMLRQGRPANDIAVYLPTHDAWAHLPLGEVNLWETLWRRLGLNLLPSLLEAGYNLDFIDDETLAQQGHVEKGKLTFAGQDFSVVVLPAVERIPPATLAKLGEFAKGGGTLIATRRLPSLGPGFLHQDTERADVARQVDELFKGPTAPGHFVAEESKPLEDELTRLYPPDVAFSPRSRDIGFIHRHTDSSEIYFIANTSNRRFEGTASFRVKGKDAEWWNLFNAEVTPAETVAVPDRRSVLKLDIEPYGSRLVVFSDRKPPKAPAMLDVKLPEPIDLSKGWQVTFEGAGKEISMDSLRSWTTLKDLQFFSGRATYQKKFDAAAGFLKAGVRAELNFGEGTPLPVQPTAHFQAWLDGPVREAAEVYVNGQRVGTVWHPPYELDVTHFLRAGENELRIVVGNLAVNEMAGSPLPDCAALTARYGKRFEDQGNELVKPVPSGLMGTIRLIARRQGQER
ncbi:MAG: glycosyl hydrolase [Terriglobia bacterium]